MLRAFLFSADSLRCVTPVQEFFLQNNDTAP
jgi:hypothetical protein